MSIYPLRSSNLRSRRRASEAREFQVMFLLAFLIFLAAGVIRRLFHPFDKNSYRNPLIAEAKAAANTCLPFAFMN